MTVPVNDAQVRAVLLDIEGTTTSVDFVYKTLFPYARNHVREFIERHYGTEELRANIERLRQEHAADITKQSDPPRWRNESHGFTVDSIVAYVCWLMDRDRKSTALKSLQGKIWEAGYRSGKLRSHVYQDVPRAFTRWQRQKIDISTFSSGSVLAQRLLFTHTSEGDLSSFIRAYFDTTTGAKTDADSYRRIASALGLPPSGIVFLSDSTAELDAAQLAGARTSLCTRPGRPQADPHGHAVFQSFDEILP